MKVLVLHQIEPLTGRVFNETSILASRMRAARFALRLNGLLGCAEHQNRTVKWDHCDSLSPLRICAK
jgi:hypothetical protein